MLIILLMRESYLNTLKILFWKLHRFSSAIQVSGNSTGLLLQLLNKKEKRSAKESMDLDTETKMRKKENKIYINVNK